MVENEDALESGAQGQGPSPEDEPEARSLIEGLSGLDKAQAGISAFLIAVVGVLAFSNALGLPFHLDDQRFLVENEALHRVETVSQAWDSERLRPVAALSLAINWSLGNGSSGAFHLINVFLHVLNSILVFLICRRFLGDKIPAAIGMLAGMLFAAHPAVTQAVNALAARSLLLGTMFILLSVFFFLRGIQREGQLGYAAIGLSLLSFALAWATDAGAWIVPFLLVFATIAAGRNDSLRERALLFLPYGLLLGACLITTSLVDAGVGRFDSGTFSVFAHARAFAAYLSPTFLPLSLQVEHAPFDAASQGLPWLWAGCVLAALALMRFAPIPGLAVLWYTLAVFAQGVFAADESFREERLYLPLAGLVLVLPWCLSKLRKPPLRLVAGVASAVLILGSVAMTSTRNNVWRSEAELWIRANDACPQCYGPVEHLALLHLQQGERTLRSIADGEAGLKVESTRQEAQEHFSLAQTFFTSATQDPRADAALLFASARTQNYLGDPEAATKSLKRAIGMDPNDQQSLLLMAALTSDRADLSGSASDLRHAIEYLQRARQLSELPPGALSRYAVLLTRQGNLRAVALALRNLPAEAMERIPGQILEEIAVKGQALQATQEAINQRTQEGAPTSELTALRARRLHLEGRYVSSSYLAREALRTDFPAARVWNLLGVNSAKTASMDQFLLDWPEGPEGAFDAESWRNLAGACASIGEWNAALEVLAHVQTKSEDEPAALVSLAGIAFGLGQLQRAAAFYRRAIDADPSDVTALLGMADLLLAQDQIDGARYFITQAQAKGASESELEARKERAGIEETGSRGLRRTIIR